MQSTRSRPAGQIPSVVAAGILVAFAAVAAAPARAQSATRQPDIVPPAQPAPPARTASPSRTEPSPRADAAPAGVSRTVAPAPDPGPAEIAPALTLTVGKSTLLKLPGAIDRISVGNPAVADVTLISARELYLLGKTFGSTNVILWTRNGPTTIVDVTVGIDAQALVEQLRQVMPEETGIRIHPTADTLVLTGAVSSVTKADYAASIAEGFARAHSRSLTTPVLAGDQRVDPAQALQLGFAQAQGGMQAAQRGSTGGPRVVNLLQVTEPQQVLLEVKVAEVSKNLLDKLGASVTAFGGNGNRIGVVSSLLVDGAGSLFGRRLNSSTLSSTVDATTGLRSTVEAYKGVSVDAQRSDGVVKVLAEPNITAISGQEASFLSGGKIFIPVARTNSMGGTTITLEEKEFGVGLKFTPTVLDGGRISLRVAPEVSELAQSGSPFTTVNGVTAVLPSFTTRRAQTTVQVSDGQSIVIAGLIKNNVTETVKRLPLLGELPILGALFRSSEFLNDRTELMFVITPRLVKPISGPVALPTDRFVPPTREEFFLEGRLEGSGHPDVPPDRRPALQRAAEPAPAPRPAAQAAPAGVTPGFETR